MRSATVIPRRKRALTLSPGSRRPCAQKDTSPTEQSCAYAEVLSAFAVLGAALVLLSASVSAQTPANIGSRRSPPPRRTRRPARAWSSPECSRFRHSAPTPAEVSLTTSGGGAPSFVSGTTGLTGVQLDGHRRHVHLVRACPRAAADPRHVGPGDRGRSDIQRERRRRRSVDLEGGHRRSPSRRRQRRPTGRRRSGPREPDECAPGFLPAPAADENAPARRRRAQHLRGG